MRIAATALIILSAAVPGHAAEPTAAPAAGTPARPTPDVHASLPDSKQVPRPRVDVARPPRGRVCFNQAETREKIASHRLSDPLRALRLGRQQGEALSAKLCRWNGDEFVYEIHVLRRDGHVVHVYMDAQTGESVGGATGPDRDRN